MSEELCPICRHAVGGHTPSCAEAGCACIFDPKGKRIVADKKPLAFASFDAVPAAERSRVTTRAPRFFKRGGSPWVTVTIVVAVLIIMAAIVIRHFAH